MEKKSFAPYFHQCVKAVNDDGTIRFRLITDALDSYSEVVMPKGARHDRIKSNFPWLWSHNLEQFGGMIRPPIGKGLVDTIEQTEKYFDVNVMFDEANDEFAKMIAAKHRSGFLSAVSVGFQPVTISMEPYRAKEGQKGVTHLEYIVLEGSSVPIGANPEALQQKEWGEFQEACAKHGFTKEHFRAAMKACNWDEYIIKDALPSETISVMITVDKESPSEKPYPNEHACRLAEPGDYAEFKRGTRKHKDKNYSIIFGKKKDGDSWEEQAYRYQKDDWTASEAGDHCTSHDGKFEAASGDEDKDKLSAPLDSKMLSAEIRNKALKLEKEICTKEAINNLMDAYEALGKVFDKAVEKEEQNTEILEAIKGLTNSIVPESNASDIVKAIKDITAKL